MPEFSNAGFFDEGAIDLNAMFCHANATRCNAIAILCIINVTRPNANVT
jgi:hypothetical protein